MTLSISVLSGDDLEDALPDLARLRIEVFRAFPYLYDGDLAYEQKYLAALVNARDPIIVAARDGDRIVGCATGSALDASHSEFAAPLKDAGVDPTETFYCAESVLLAGYRGRRIGHAFFDHREAHARTQGFKRSCFCAVVRPGDHPMRPADYSPLDPFWRGRGYSPLKGAVARFSWKDLGQPEETEKPMQVWIRNL